jgi:hypothetical protein
MSKTDVSAENREKRAMEAFPEARQPPKKAVHQCYAGTFSQVNSSGRANRPIE